MRGFACPAPAGLCVASHRSPAGMRAIRRLDRRPRLSSAAMVPLASATAYAVLGVAIVGALVLIAILLRLED